MVRSKVQKVEFGSISLLECTIHVLATQIRDSLGLNVDVLTCSSSQQIDQHFPILVSFVVVQWALSAPRRSYN